VKRLLLAVVVAFLAGAPVARADEPTRGQIQVLPSLHGVCGSFFGTNPLEQHRVATLYSDGRQTDTGKLVVRVTHLDGDGSKSLVLDVSGPLFFSAVGAGGSQTIEGTGKYALGCRRCGVPRARAGDPRPRLERDEYVLDCGLCRESVRDARVAA
jgi:hypothetical protein